MIITREFMMPVSHPVLPGHFPGDPIVPGVILLAWCEQLAADLTHSPVIVRNWLSVKFLRPLKPGQTCWVSIESGSGSRAVFRILANQVLVASGDFEWTVVSL